MKLGKNFTLEELTKSQQGTRLGIDNTPSEEVFNNLRNLVENLLQPLRNKIALPITISSGYRCKELNRVIGGAKNSDHVQGYAADIEVPGLDNKSLFTMIRIYFKFTKLILEFYEEGKPDSGWVHASYNPLDLKQECLIATRENGKVVYRKFR